MDWSEFCEGWLLLSLLLPAARCMHFTRVDKVNNALSTFV